LISSAQSLPNLNFISSDAADVILRIRLLNP
jgi:hypothetical protein